MNRTSYDLGSVIRAAIEARMVHVHTHLPARVLSYDAAKQKVSVQIEVQQAAYDETGERVPETIPPVNDVPVVFPRGGGARLTFPIAVGDKCLLAFSEASLDRWKYANNSTAVDPDDDRRHHLTDAFAIFGIADYAHAMKNVPTDRVSIGYDSGATVEIHNDEVRLGGDDASDPVVRKSDLAQVVTALNLHGHSVVVSGPGTFVTGVPLAAAAPPTPPSTAFSTPACSPVVMAK